MQRFMTPIRIIKYIYNERVLIYKHLFLYLCVCRMCEGCFIKKTIYAYYFVGTQPINSIALSL